MLRNNLHRTSRVLILLAAIVVGFAIYTYGVPGDPPGFFTDESSIAYNAWTISQSGKDEYGVFLPLYFRALDEYKNPVFIYLLASLYYFTGPSILVARLLSCTLGFLAAVVLGLLAARISRRLCIGVTVALTALLTPWLVETCRLVLEVSLYPLALALFLLVLYYAQEKEKWSLAESALIVFGLGLLTYTYTIGRLFAPLLAFGMILFANRRRWVNILQVWIAYAVTLIPIAVFHLNHPGALTARYQQVSYITSAMPYMEICVDFIKHGLHNLSLLQLLRGSIIKGSDLQTGAVLVATAILAGMGLVLVLKRHARDPWWRFVLYGLVVSVVPASLADGYFAILRLIPYVVFLLILTVPALEALRDKRRYVFMLLVVLTLAQGSFFFWQYHRIAPTRIIALDGYYPQVFAATISTGRRPIYLAEASYPFDHGRYVHAYWYGVLHGMSSSAFTRLPIGTRPPQGSVVISTEPDCLNCEVIMKAPSSVRIASGWTPYIVYIAH